MESPDAEALAEAIAWFQKHRPDTPPPHVDRLAEQVAEAVVWFRIPDRQVSVLLEALEGVRLSPSGQTEREHAHRLYRKLGVSDRMGMLLRVMGRRVPDDFEIRHRARR